MGSRNVIIIFAGIDRIPLVESGFDLSVPVVGDVGDFDYFKENSGLGK